MELDQTFSWEGLVSYNKEEEQFYLNDEIVLSIWDDLELLKSRNAPKVVAE